MSQITLPRQPLAPHAEKDTALRLALNNFACAVAVREKQPEANKQVHTSPEEYALAESAELASVLQTEYAVEAIYAEINAFVANYVANLLCVRRVEREEDNPPR